MRARLTPMKALEMDRHEQVNRRAEHALYQALETVARQERRALSQAACQLLAEGLRQRLGNRAIADDLSGHEITVCAAAGGALAWSAEEPDLYDDTRGEPLLWWFLEATSLARSLTATPYLCRFPTLTCP